MTENDLYHYHGKNIIVTCDDGQKIKGFCSIVTSALDNDSEVASIVVEAGYACEITLPEIKSIDIIESEG